MKNRFTVSRTSETVYYGAVFEIKKEIPVDILSDRLSLPDRLRPGMFV